MGQKKKYVLNPKARLSLLIYKMYRVSEIKLPYVQRLMKFCVGHNEDVGIWANKKN